MLHAVTSIPRMIANLSDCATKHAQICRTAASCRLRPIVSCTAQGVPSQNLYATVHVSGSSLGGHRSALCRQRAPARLRGALLVAAAAPAQLVVSAGLAPLLTSVALLVLALAAAAFLVAAIPAVLAAARMLRQMERTMQARCRASFFLPLFLQLSMSIVTMHMILESNARAVQQRHATVCCAQLVVAILYAVHT